MKKIVMASNNKKKMAELQSLLADLNVEVVNQGSLGIPSAEEPFETFLENALAKARHASALSGLPAMADDSGICAEALGGAPGVKSARYAGLPSNDANNNAKLLRDLEGAADRRAHYTCVIVAVRSAFDPEPLVTTEHWEGTIGFEARGEGGFGYDPYFVLPDGRHAAEISAEEKNRLSHRGKAMRLFLAKVKDVWHW